MTKTLARILVPLLVCAATACNRHPAESRVKSVEARIDGITCPTCVPPLKASLQKQYKTSAIDVSDDTDTATIHFANAENFSAADFHAAVERVHMHVVTIRLQACGTVEPGDGAKIFTAGANRFRVQSDRDVPVNTTVCADGTLETGSDPAIFRVSSFTENSK
jgi:hypothetical protein